MDGHGDAYLQQFMDETTFYNRIVLGSFLPMKLWDPLPHFIQTWVRNYIGGTLVYLLSGFLWCFYIYYLKRNVFVPKGIYAFWLFGLGFAWLLILNLFLYCLNI